MWLLKFLHKDDNVFKLLYQIDSMKLLKFFKYCSDYKYIDKITYILNKSLKIQVNDKINENKLDLYSVLYLYYSNLKNQIHLIQIFYH